MPRQPGGVSKSKRLEALRQVLKRWGRLNKAQVDEHVGANLNCDSEAISRALYRDLEELVEMGEVEAIHFSRDGVVIEEFDPEVHKNTFCEWTMKQTQSGHIGSGLLDSLNIQLLPSPRLKSVFSISEVNVDPDPHKISIYCFLENSALCIRFDKEELPLQLSVGRVGEEDFEGVIEGRTAVMLFPIRTLSSFKGTERQGHFNLAMRSDGSAELQDQGSKNGTWVKNLSFEEAMRELATERTKRVSTVSMLGVRSLVDQLGEMGRLVPKELCKASLPFVVETSAQFKWIVFG